MKYPDFIEHDFPFPPFVRIVMRYPDNEIKDIQAAVVSELAAVLPASGIQPGDSVAVGVGSRGISEIRLMLRTLCEELIRFGAEPVIIPAMGSHGGATPEGQQKVLEQLGVTENSCGAPIVSSLRTRQISHVLGEVPVYYSQDALDCDHSIFINRIKPHTKFKGKVESGLLKMLCVGMGKHAGALAYHQWAMKYGFGKLLQITGSEILAKANFRFALAVIENHYDRPFRIEAVPASRVLEREPELLAFAKENMPKIPVSHVDALIVTQAGKEISGSGMDPNITGRTMDLMEDDFSCMFNATRIAILDLSEKTGGNAIGIGNADFITEKLFQKIDYESTIMNAMTSLSIRKAFIPVRLPNDKKAIQACFTTIGPVAPEKIKAVIIRDTLHLSEFLASVALVPEIQKNPFAHISEPFPLVFNESGDLKSHQRFFH